MEKRPLNSEAIVAPDSSLRISLMPPAREMPDSSLAHMIDVVMDRLGAEGSAHCASVEHGIDTDRLAGTLHEAERAGAPVCLLGTSFAYVRWLYELNAAGAGFRLPAGSRLMDTGGYKGHGREVDEHSLRALYAGLLGVPDTHCVNEYGMTEMTSQFYDSTLRLPGPRRKIPPPWVRTQVVDPDTLSPLRDASSPGLLRHTDLGNLGSVVAIQTEDLGVAVDDGFHVLGRAAGAQPRGCSIAMDELLGAVRDRA